MKYSDQQVLDAMASYLAEAAGAQNPPFCNTGVPTTHPPLNQDHPKGIFDWYSATVAEHPESIIEGLIHEFGGSFEEAKPMHSFTDVLRHSSLNLFVMYGGKNPHPHIQASGQEAHKVAEWIRDVCPEHRVSRADVAFDFKGDVSFDELVEIVKPIARAKRTSCTFVGDPETEYGAGRTWYFGSRKSSDVFIRLYEKGLEQRAKGNPNAPKDWVRLEVVVKPRKANKLRAAKLSPLELVGMSKFALTAVEKVLDTNITHIPDPTLRKNRDEASLEHMATQYGRVLRRFVEDKGWSELNHFLYTTIYTQKERAKMEANRAVHPIHRDKH